MRDEIPNPTPETHERIQALARAFVASIPHAEILQLIETGPNAVASCCFRWAFDTARELDEVGRVDPTRAASLMPAAPWVRLLERAAFERIALVHGVPVAPPMPALPDGVDVHATSQLECRSVRTVRSARRVGYSLVYSRMGGGDQIDYLVGEHQRRKCWILYARYDCDYHGKTHTDAVATCGRHPSLGTREAAMLLLQAFWGRLHADYGWDEPNEWNAYDPLSADDLRTVADTVWAPREPTSG